VRQRAEHGEPCHLCGRVIDVTLPALHPLSFTADHLMPISRGGDPHAATNLAPAHRLCNLRRGARPPRPLPPVPPRPQPRRDLPVW